MRLDGRVAVVTGGAGGIGAALGRALAKEGCTVALVDVSEAPLRAVGAEIPGASIHVVDVSDAAAMVALAEEVVRQHGAVHLVVNNAGVTVVGSFLEHSDADWQRVIGVNLMGVVNGCRAFLPHLAKADEARIVNVSSMFGLLGIPGQSAYCATKFAVRGLGEALAAELAGTKIGVTTVHPGGIRTGIVANGRMAQGAPAGDGMMQKLGTFFEQHTQPPEVVARAVVSAVKANRPRVRVCRETYVADWVMRVAPVTGHRLVVSVIRKAMGLDRAIADRQAQAAR